MKSLVQTYILIIIMSFSPVLLSAQERNSREWIEAAVNPPLWKGEPVLKFTHSRINVGLLSEDDAPSVYRFEFCNVSNRTITLTKVTTSCGCTASSFHKDPIKPGEKDTITLTFNPFEKVGTLDARAFVYTSVSSQNPTAKIELTGEVLPTSDKWSDFRYTMGKLRLRRKVVQFKELTKTIRSTERIVCANSGETPLKLSALILPDYAQLRVEPEVIPPGGEADIVITVNGLLLPATTKDVFSFSILLDGLDVRPSDRTIQVKVALLK